MPIEQHLLTQMKTSLLAGHYNLFLGAGASFGATNKNGHEIPIGDALRSDLINLKGLRASSSLYRAYSQLTDLEVNENITQRFLGCTSTSALDLLPTFVWNRIYTLNVDDCLEAAYRIDKAKQVLEPLTHKSIFKNTTFRGNLHVVHIHGFAAKDITNNNCYWFRGLIV